MKEIKTIELNIQKDIRYGQFIFNFLEWVGHKYPNLKNERTIHRLSDTFNLSDDEFKQLLDEYNNI